ncbi:hypothetical protein [Streptomyces sp. KL116D]
MAFADNHRPGTYEKVGFCPWRAPQQSAAGRRLAGRGTMAVADDWRAR